jgi:hypothetical protein
MVCALVGAAVATGNFHRGGCGAGRNCVGAVGFGQGGRLVRVSVRGCAAGAAGNGGGHALDLASHAEQRAAAAAVLPAARAGESLPAGKSVGGRAGSAGSGRDADSGGLPDAGRAAARSARDGIAPVAEYLPDRCDNRRGCGGEGLLCAPAGRDSGAGPDARGDGPVCLPERQDAGAVEGAALSAADAGECGADLGRCAAGGRQGDAGQMVDQQ